MLPPCAPSRQQTAGPAKFSRVLACTTMQARIASPCRERLREDSKVEALKKLAQKIQKTRPDEGAGLQALMDTVQTQDS